MRFSPQQQKVIDYIERWGSINSILAISKLGVTRLAARIHEIQHSNRAMKAIITDDVAPGFVTYVPDWEKRRQNLTKRHLSEIERARPHDIAEINLKYTAKHTLLNTKEREYKQEYR